MNLEIRRVTNVDLRLIEPLVLQSEIEGYRYVRYLANAWASGEQRFTDPGEVLFGAFADELWIGTGGLTRDPYTPGPENGRVRRMYVHPSYRGYGIGRSLLNAVLAAAAGHFPVLQLFTENPAAAKMYESAGFERVNLERVTHRLLLSMF